MPIALGASSSEDCRTGLPEFATGMTCIPMYKSPEFSVGGQRGEVIVENDGGRSSSSSSSSIGRNSDESAAGGDADGEGLEVQGSAIHLEDLEEALRLKEETWSLSLRVLLQYSDSWICASAKKTGNGGSG
ncbi:PREDICTED: uncharacterized protein LOC109193205 isoform X2 [Ipomoea nil]|uniref:uncharacterized protein LOC109193205 isoform X2 n=1 Tax=Ipomoea nil TaxID=35883 RepID=UPI000901FCC4|nr:PREDICTED: uncharacterized protein LOC109193205 isoform X2 [Ipomoea nil]